MRRVQKIIFYLVVYGSLFLATLLIGEWLLGKVYPTRITYSSFGQQRYVNLREARPFLDGEIVPNPLEIERTSLLPDRKYKLRGDENGFWLPARVHDSSDADIYFLGGSTTACIYNEEDKRFPYWSGRMLEEKTGLKINSFNGGYNSNASIHSINTLLNKVIGLKADVAVMMHACNDLGMLSRYGTYWSPNSGNLQTVLVDQTIRRPKAATYTMWKAFFPNIDRALHRSRVAARNNSVKSVALSDSAMIRMFRRNLETFVFLCKQHDIEPVLMTQGHRIKKEDQEVTHFFEAIKNPGYFHSTPLKFDHWQELELMFNQTIRDVGVQHGVMVIDLEKGLNGIDSVFYDPYHLTDFGNGQASEIISDSLSTLLRSKAFSEGEQ